MSLNWDITKVEDSKDLCHNDDGSLSVVTEALIFITIPIEIGEITEKNYEEFWARVRLVELTCGPMCSFPDGPRLLTLENVRSHIGLHTNAGPEITRKKWLSGYMSRTMDDMVRDEHRKEKVSV